MPSQGKRSQRLRDALNMLAARVCVCVWPQASHGLTNEFGTRVCVRVRACMSVRERDVRTARARRAGWAMWALQVRRRAGAQLRRCAGAHVCACAPEPCRAVPCAWHPGSAAATRFFRASGAGRLRVQRAPPERSEPVKPHRGQADVTPGDTPRAKARDAVAAQARTRDASAPALAEDFRRHCVAADPVGHHF